MVMALRQIASAPQDPWGRLEVMATQDGNIWVGGRCIPAECWEQLQAAQVLQSCGPGTGLFAFAERSLMHHVLLLASNDIPIPDIALPEEGERVTGLRAPVRHTIPLRA